MRIRERLFTEVVAILRAHRFPIQFMHLLNAAIELSAMIAFTTIKTIILQIYVLHNAGTIAQ